MGFDCGFDIHPRLEVNAENIQSYQSFLDEITRTYKDVYDKDGRRADGKVLVMPADISDDSSKSYIRFMVGECPHMPSNPARCDYFLRFSSKVSGRLTTPAAPYIRSVRKIAEKYFGSRVHFWHELNETGDKKRHGYYNWQEIHDASAKLRELESQEARNETSCAQEEPSGTEDEPKESSGSG